MKIRAEQPEDFGAIHQVNIAAFDRVNEAVLVDSLREVVHPVLSFVAVAGKPVGDGEIVGHIFFSPVSVESEHRLNCRVLGLAPIAVLPQFQRQGIGSLLVQHGLRECAHLNYDAVVVLGHPDYYPRFGFVPARERGLVCEYDVPDEVFMVVELKSKALQGCSGTIKYRPEFARV